ncbi:hypothetical protein SAMN05428985_107260 [Nocardioides sp. YR527]|nr:hypothetical protein SAMN05428985_107260 [Nocardioides sp. YR527]
MAPLIPGFGSNRGRIPPTRVGAAASSRATLVCVSFRGGKYAWVAPGAERPVSDLPCPMHSADAVASASTPADPVAPVVRVGTSELSRSLAGGSLLAGSPWLVHLGCCVRWPAGRCWRGRPGWCIWVVAFAGQQVAAGAVALGGQHGRRGCAVKRATVCETHSGRNVRIMTTPQGNRSLRRRDYPADVLGSRDTFGRNLRTARCSRVRPPWCPNSATLVPLI